ncbi:c-type cytochrome [Terasakiella pusilla]|jgi:mono/diheme cytochrome c family protein|uniref:c-type cytochrome n=1 Tax=Terasakiella pusilla TaxID=64973 RepID=UPI0004901CE6|nr:cytochrome c [Terasakiella pusilla]
MNKNAIALSVAVVFTIGAATAAFLHNAENSGVADPNDPKQVALGKTIYADNCASCHGVNLEGETEDWKSTKEDGTLYAPPHDDTGHTWHHGDALLFQYTKEGGQAIAGPDFQSGMMPFADALTDEEIWAALAFIKTSWTEQQLNRQQMMTEREKEQ